jgi:hypothetical protein
MLFLFTTGCRPAELVDAKKKKKKKKEKRRTPRLDNDETCADDVDDEGFDDAKVDDDADFGFDDDHDRAVAALGSENNVDGSDDDAAMSKWRKDASIMSQVLQLSNVGFPAFLQRLPSNSSIGAYCTVCCFN